MAAVEPQLCAVVQDFKTGHITMSSPRAMFIAQIAGALMGKHKAVVKYSEGCFKTQLTAMTTTLHSMRYSTSLNIDIVY